MLIARSTTFAAIFDAFNELPLNRIPVRPDDIAVSAEPATWTG
jgi:hypothetical protein